MKKSLFILMTSLFFSSVVVGQEKLLTIAEKSDFKSTSDYEDVKTFISELLKVIREYKD